MRETIWRPVNKKQVFPREPYSQAGLKRPLYEVKKKKKMDVNYLATALKLRDRENSMITWSKHNEHLSFFLLISVLTSYKLVCFQQMHQVQSFWQMCKWHEYAVGNAWCNFPSPCRFLMEGKSQWFDSHGLIRIACSCSLISWCCWGNELIFYYW